MPTPSPIHSVENSRFRQWVQTARRGRLPEGDALLAVEGPKLLDEALRGGWRPVLVAYTVRGIESGAIQPGAGWLAAAESLFLAPHLFEKLADTVTPQEPFVLVRPPDWIRSPESLDSRDATSRTPAGAGPVLPEGLKRLVVADGVQDPGNLGTILRSARAFGFDTVATTPGSAGTTSSKVLRASAGALFRCRVIPNVTADTLAAELGRCGFLVVVLDPRGDRSIEGVEWREPLAIVTGGEAQGPSGAWEKPARDAGTILRARIPMSPDSESLNTATAAALALYAAARALG